MRIFFIVFFSLTFAVGNLSMVCANAEEDDSFYRDSIERRIDQCEQNRQLLQSKSENLRIYGKKKDKEARFYHENRENLIEEMIRKQVPKKSGSVQHFLIKASQKRNPAAPPYSPAEFNAPQ